MVNDLAFAALLAGVISAISLPIGAALGLATRPGPKLTSALMAFGGGALLFALTLEIVAPSFEHAGFVPLAIGCLLGGIAFELLNQILNSQGAFLRKAATFTRELTRLKRKRTDRLLERLSHVPLLQKVEPEAMARLIPAIRIRKARDGESIFNEGEPGDCAYLVDSGNVEVTRNGEPVARLGEGEVFGEMSLLTGAPRTATLSAAGAAVLFCIQKEDFDDLIRSSPETGQRVRDLVVERTEDLASRMIVPEAEAREWADAACASIEEQDLTVSTAEMEEAAKAHGSHAALGIWLGILLDGIPESLVIGTSAKGMGSLPWALIAGVFLANLPEAMSSSVVMRTQGYTKSRVFVMWFSITAITGIGALAGSLFLRELSPEMFAVIEGMAAGAMLTMIAETMLPEAYERGGAVVGISTLLGFLAALFVKWLAH